MILLFTNETDAKLTSATINIALTDHTEINWTLSSILQLLSRQLAEDGYAGIEVRVTPVRTEIIIKATRTQDVLGEKGQRIRELTSVVQKRYYSWYRNIIVFVTDILYSNVIQIPGCKLHWNLSHFNLSIDIYVLSANARFNFKDGAVEIFAERVANRGLCSQTQAESLKYKLLGGLAVRRACYGVLRFVMESGAKGAEVSVSGKVRGQRAKSQKFSDGYMIKTGHAYDEYVDTAVRHVMMRQGILGVKVSIMLPHDPKGIIGPKSLLSDVITILEPKESN